MFPGGIQLKGLKFAGQPPIDRGWAGANKNMYQKFFSLDELPFEGSPDRRFYYVGSAQGQALDLLTQNLSRPGAICVLSGPSGSGKTTLVRMLIRSLPRRVRIIAIDDPRLDEHTLLATVLRASGIVATSYETLPELTHKLRTLLERAISDGILTTVILDEAQGLSDAVLEQIRLISNIEGEAGRMLNFLLVGQEELIAHIQKKNHHMLYGRVRAFAAIPALKRDEVLSYVSFRLQQAGCVTPLFSAGAVSALCRSSGGLPRLINAIADRSLTLAFRSRRSTVSARIVKRATQTVRSPRRGARARLKALARGLLAGAAVRLPLLACGVLLAAACFSAAYFYLPAVLDSESVASYVRRDELVEGNYRRLLAAMLESKAGGRDSFRFANACAASVFKSEAVANLIRLWGFERADGELMDCGDLRYVQGQALACRTRAGTLEALRALNRPAVLSLRDANLVPFFGVLTYLDGETAELLLDRYIFRIERPLLEDIYDGEFTVVRALLPELDDASAGLVKKTLEDLSGKEIKNRGILELEYERFRGNAGHDALFDLKADSGPRLDKSAFAAGAGRG